MEKDKTSSRRSLKRLKIECLGLHSIQSDFVIPKIKRRIVASIKWNIDCGNYRVLCEVQENTVVAIPRYSIYYKWRKRYAQAQGQNAKCCSCAEIPPATSSTQRAQG